MATNDYHFISEWRIPGTITEVFDVQLAALMINVIFIMKIVVTSFSSPVSIAF